MNGVTDLEHFIAFFIKIFSPWYSITLNIPTTKKFRYRGCLNKKFLNLE